MKNYINENRIHKLSLGESSVLPANKIIKLQEEAGELAQAYLKYTSSTNASASADGTPLEVIEEAGDCINVAMDIINHMIIKHPELEDEARALFDKKLDKWENKQKNYKN